MIFETSSYSLYISGMRHYQWKWPCATICWHFTVYHLAVFLLKTAGYNLSQLILRRLNFLMGTTFWRHTIAGWLTRYKMVYMWRHSLEWLGSFSKFAPAITPHKRLLCNADVKTAKCWGSTSFFRHVMIHILVLWLWHRIIW
jgi:hypothetical protein